MGFLIQGPTLWQLAPTYPIHLPPQSRVVSKTSLRNSVQRKQEEGYVLKPTQKRGKTFLLEAPLKVSPHPLITTVVSHPVGPPPQEGSGRLKPGEAGPWAAGWVHRLRSMWAAWESSSAGISRMVGVEMDVNKQPGVVSIPQELSGSDSLSEFHWAPSRVRGIWKAEENHWARSKLTVHLIKSKQKSLTVWLAVTDGWCRQLWTLLI